MEILTYVLANIIGILLIVFVVWWFWLGKKTKAVKVTNQVVDIKVADGVYTPDAVQVKLGQTVTLRFNRTDETPCSATVIFADFNQSAELPINEAVELQIKADKAGEFEFTCQMGMYRGRLVVSD